MGGRAGTFPARSDARFVHVRAFASTQSGIVVNPAAASVFAFTGLPSSTTAGQSQSFTLTARDAYGNRTSYFGTVLISSSDSQASLPSL